MVPADQNPCKRYFTQAGHVISSTFAVLVFTAAATVMLSLAKSQLSCTNSQLSVLCNMMGWWLSAEPLYAIGDFFTLGGGQAEFDLQAAENQLISKWKTDFADLLQRFDGDQDGRLNEQEWQQVRSSARQLAEQSHRERSIQSPQYYLRKPQEKQPFVLSSYAEKDIAKRFKRQALVGTFFCMLSALGGAYLINTHFLVS